MAASKITHAVPALLRADRVEAWLGLAYGPRPRGEVGVAGPFVFLSRTVAALSPSLTPHMCPTHFTVRGPTASFHFAPRPASEADFPVLPSAASANIFPAPPANPSHQENDLGVLVPRNLGAGIKWDLLENTSRKCNAASNIIPVTNVEHYKN